MMSTITSTCDVSQPIYEDLDALLPAVKDGSQSEVQVKPVPRPRSRIQPKSQCNNNNSTVDSADATTSTPNAVCSQLGGYPADYKKQRPVRPPPRPPLYSHKYKTSSKATVAGGRHHMTSISEAPDRPPAVDTDRLESPTRPERPPLPSSYSRCSTMRLKPESGTDEDQQPRCSPVPPDVSKEEVSLCETSSTTPPAVDTDRLDSPTRPERPPLPSSYSRCSTIRLKPESCIDEGQQSCISSMQQPPVSEVNTCGTYCTTINYKSGTDEGQQPRCSPVPPDVSKEEVTLCKTSSTTPPADSTEKVYSPTRPERPRRPASYSRCSAIRLNPESGTDEGQQSRCSPVLPDVSKEEVTLCETSSTTSCNDESQQSCISSMQQPPVSEVNTCGTYCTTINYKSGTDEDQQSRCSPVPLDVSKEEVTLCETSSTTPPADSTEKVYTPTRPERPRLPSSYSRCSTTRLKPESGTDEGQQSRCSPVPPDVSKEEVTLCGTSSTTRCIDESQQSCKSSMQQPPVSELNISGIYSTVSCKSGTDEDQQPRCSPVPPDVSKEEVTLCDTSSTTPPVDSTEKVYSPTRPERPRPPSSHSRCSTMKLKPESGTDEGQQSRCSPVPPDVSKEEVTLCGTASTTSCTDESQQSNISSMQQPPASPAVPEVNICGIYRTVCKSGTDESQQSKYSMQQPPVSSLVAKETIPPPPSFTPPPPKGKPLSTLYSQIDHRPYLDVLPEDADKKTLEKPTIVRYQTACRTLTLQHTIEDTEDINGMLRWMKRVSKTDLMNPTVYGLGIEEEIRSFSQRAMNVRKALRLYNLLMMKRNESLRNIITEFSSISDSLDKLKKKSKTMDIAGGTTGAVGGVTAVLGIAFAPMTLGTSLIATAVGAGMVASAGGMGAHTAKANKKIVNRMAVEKLVYDYKKDVVDLEICLSFILTGMNELRMHDAVRLQRAGAQAEVLKVAHLSQSVFKSTMSKDGRTTVAHMSGMSSERLLLAFAKDMDHYFTEKDGLKLKKSNKSRFSVRVRLLAENLQDELCHLNCMWEMFG